MPIYKSYNDRNSTCRQCTNCCNLGMSINSQITEYFSDKYHNLEYNYPMKKCKCHDFGINPKYYTPIYIQCRCKCC